MSCPTLPLWGGLLLVPGFGNPEAHHSLVPLLSEWGASSKRGGGRLGSTPAPPDWEVGDAQYMQHRKHASVACLPYGREQDWVSLRRLPFSTSQSSSCHRLIIQKTLP